MFTGLIQATGAIADIRQKGNYHLLDIKTSLADESLQMGESIACDGACLTVIEFSAGRFVAEASQETYARTILRHYRRGTEINLERALRVGDRLGGHFVMGHVDDVGVIDRVREVGRSLEVIVGYDKAHDVLVVDKGSIAVNGISLTVNSTQPGKLSVNIIPHSAAETTVTGLRPGSQVNLEFDMIGKYLLKRETSTEDKKLTIERLKQYGW